jgi:oxygen-dependent protoporphyrinogen oxidase
MNKAKLQVSVIGGGFSGLTLAYELARQGILVTVFEKSPKLGGLIQSYRTDQMLVETGANALIYSEEIHHLFLNLGLPYFKVKKESKRRFFFHQGKLKQWPLNFFETIILFFRVLKILFKGFSSAKPYDRETVSQWGLRLLGKAFTRQVLGTALNGVYAGKIEEMSASLVLGRFFNQKKSGQRKYKGSIAPENGMGQLIDKLKSHLIKQGVVFLEQEVLSLKDFDHPVVLAISLNGLNQFRNEVDFGCNHLTMLPLVRATMSIQDPQNRIEGFGALFCPDEGLKTLGVLANTMIFEERGPTYNESWIIGGTRSPEVLHFSDEEVKKLIVQERSILFSKSQKALEPISEIEVIRWSQALPHYDLRLEDWLKNISKKKFVNQQKQKIYLTGNYLGRLGLSQIYEMNQELAVKIKNELEVQTERIKT